MKCVRVCRLVNAVLTIVAGGVDNGQSSAETSVLKVPHFASEVPTEWEQSASHDKWRTERGGVRSSRRSPIRITGAR